MEPNRAPTMRQRKITDYFPQPLERRPRVSFLSLPYSIRRRIYLQVGLVSEIMIVLNHDCSVDSVSPNAEDRLEPESWPLQPIETGGLSPRSQSLAHFLDGPLPGTHLDRFCMCWDIPTDAMRHINPSNYCPCNPFPYQLLYVSDLLTKEIKSIFFAENKFAIFRFAHGGLSNLQSLPQEVLSSMRSLWICLNFDGDYSGGDSKYSWSMPYYPEECSCSLVGGFKMRRQIKVAKNKNDRQALREWDGICKRLALIPPSRLQLTFTCDMFDEPATMEYLEPLNQLPQLKDCAIRLDANPHDTWCGKAQNLAREVAETLCGNVTRGPFQYNNLPQEIQNQILENTDLVSSLDIVWDDQSDLAKSIETQFVEFQFYRYYPHRLGNCCEECSYSTGGCCCWTRSASFSTSCTCWKMPMGLFRTSKKMRQDAQRVFLLKNKFVVGAFHKGRLSLEMFLKRMSPDMRGYVRNITWLVPSRLEIQSNSNDGHDYSEENLTPWLNTVSMLKDRNLSQLTISFEMDWLNWDYEPGYGFPGPYPKPRNPWTSGMIIAGSISRTNFKNCYFHLKEKEWMPMERDIDHGRELEKIVMGEDYDSREMGKYTRRHRWNGFPCEESTCECYE